MQQGAFSRAAQSIISRVAAAAGKTCVQGSGEKSTQIRRPSFNMAVSNGVSMRSMGMPSLTEYKNAGQEDTNFSPIPTLEELYNRVKGNADSSRGKTWDNSRAQSGWNSGNADDRVQSKKEDGRVVASAIPTLIMAMMTGGTSNAGMAKEGIEKAAAMAKSTDFSRYVAMARSVINQTAKNPNAQMAFIQGAGHSWDLLIYSGRQVIMKKIQSFLINMRVAGTTA